MCKMKTIIGLIGPKTCGKSTIAEHIVNKYSCSEVVIATKLKETCSEVFKIPIDHFSNQKIKEIPFISPINFDIIQARKILDAFKLPYESITSINKELTSPRHILQYIGTDFLRKVGGDDIHCNTLSLDDNFTVVSDIRLISEFDYFNNNVYINFIPLYIKRNTLEDVVDNHVSETEFIELIDKAIEIDNTNSLSSTFKQIDNVIQNNWFCIS